MRVVPRDIQGAPSPSSKDCQHQARSSSSFFPRCSAGISVVPWRNKAIQTGSGLGEEPAQASMRGPDFAVVQVAMGHCLSRPPNSQAWVSAARVQAGSPQRRPRPSSQGDFQEPSQGARREVGKGFILVHPAWHPILPRRWERSWPRTPDQADGPRVGGPRRQQQTPYGDPREG